jgi:hypothetical protein
LVDVCFLSPWNVQSLYVVICEQKKKRSVKHMDGLIKLQ